MSLRKTLTILFYVALAAIPWSLEIPLIGSTNLAMPVEAILVVMAALGLVYAGKHFSKLRFSRLDLAVLGLFVMYFVSAAFSADFIISMKFAAKFTVLGIAAYFIPRLLNFKRRQWRYATISFLSGMVLFGIYVLCQVSFYGIFFETSYILGSPFFPIGHTNLSVVFEPAFLLILSLLLLVRHNRMRLLMLCCLFIVFLAVIDYSYSRASFISTASVLVVAVVLIVVRRKRKAFLPVLLIIIFGIGGITGIRQLHYWNNRKPHLKKYDPRNRAHYRGHHALDRDLEVANWQTNMSNRDRLVRWSAGLRMFENHIVTGIGCGTFPDAFAALEQAEEKKGKQAKRMNIHNLYLSWLVEGGILTAVFGIIHMLVLALEVFRITWKRGRFRPGVLKLFLVCGLGVFFFHGLVQDFTGEVRVMFLFFSALGMLNIGKPMNLNRKKGSRSCNPFLSNQMVS